MKKFLILLLIIVSFVPGSDLHISFTGNNRGLLTPCGCKIPSGGWARIGTVLNNMPELTLHAGAGNHFFHHTPMPKEDQIFEQKKAVLQAELFSELHYDVINAGQYDLCYGLKVLNSLQRRFALPIISANILDMNGDLAFPAYKLMETQGITILFTGVCSLPDGYNYKIKDPISALEELYRSGVFEKADLAILLADAPDGLFSDFAREHPGIDLIVCAKSHLMTELPIHYKNTALVQLGSQGKYCGDLHLNFKDNITDWADITTYQHEIKMTEEMLSSGGTSQKRHLKQLKRNKKALKKGIKGHSAYYGWNMLFLDASVQDDPGIKARVNKYTPYPGE